MGSNLPPQRRNDGSIHVLVTGFDAFGRHAENPSWLIAHSLPATIPGLRKGDRKIHLHVRPQAVRVSYHYVRENIPPLLFTKDEDTGEIERNFDLVLHIGVSHARGYYEMETRAFRDDYYLHDVDGKSKADGFPTWQEEGAPEMLKVGFDPEKVLASWQQGVPDADVRMSTDAGRFLCEYILFTSLLEYHRNVKGEGFPVTFFHVPTEKDEKDLERGRNVAIALITALAQNKPK